MSKVTDLGMNLVPSRLPKKNIVATDKAEEIASKIHAIVAEPIAEPAPEPVIEKIVEKVAEPEAKIQEIKPKKQNVKTQQTILPPSVKKRSARTIIEDPDAVRKTSFDFPVALYRSMKIRLAEDGLSMRDYVIGLIEDDLNK